MSISYKQRLNAVLIVFKWCFNSVRIEEILIALISAVLPPLPDIPPLLDEYNHHYTIHPEWCHRSLQTKKLDYKSAPGQSVVAVKSYKHDHFFAVPDVTFPYLKGVILTR